ncbi:hypothetical protein V6N13_040428 [Hibiscus sabdariffa]
MILKRRPWVVHDDLFSIELYNPTWRAIDFNFNNMKPASGSRRKQGIEYFDINDVPSGVPAAPAVEDPISRAGSGTAPTDATIMKPTGVAEGPVPVASPLDSSTQPVSSVTAAKATAPAPTVPTSSANIETATCDELERVLDIESPVPKHVDSGNMIGVCQAAGTLEKVEGSCSVAGIVASDSEGRAAVCHAAVISELAGSKHAAVLQDSEEGTGMGPALPLVPSTAIGATPARAKRSLQGKYEVCTPFQPKRTRLQLSDSDSKHTGMSSLNSTTEVAEELLDRFVASHSWILKFPDFRITTIFTSHSDHCLLLLDACPGTGASRGHINDDYFRFEECWSKEPACVDRVRSVWDNTSGPTLYKLQAVGTALRGWQTGRRNTSWRRISELHSFIKSCMQGPIRASDRTAFLVAKKEHKALLDKEEAYWAQRSRISMGRLQEW